MSKVVIGSVCIHAFYLHPIVRHTIKQLNLSHHIRTVQQLWSLYLDIFTLFIEFPHHTIFTRSLNVCQIHNKTRFEKRALLGSTGAHQLWQNTGPQNRCIGFSQWGTGAAHTHH